MRRNNNFISDILVIVELMICGFMILVTLVIVNVAFTIKLSNDVQHLVNNNTTESPTIIVESQKNTETVSDNSKETVVNEQKSIEDVEENSSILKTAYKTYNYENKHPYIDPESLIPYGCPKCGYQLYCHKSAVVSASARLRCTRCDWESKQVYIENCSVADIAEERLMNIITTSNMTDDVYFPR